MKRCLIGFSTIILYIIFSYQHLNNLYNSVEKEKNEVLSSLDRQQFLLEKLSSIILEISEYNNYKLHVPIDEDRLEYIKVAIKENKINVLNLDKRIDELTLELAGSVNRVNVSQKRFNDAVFKYENAITNPIFIPISYLFKFNSINSNEISFDYKDFTFALKKEDD